MKIKKISAIKDFANIESEIEKMDFEEVMAFRKILIYFSLINIQERFFILSVIDKRLADLSLDWAV